MCPDGAQTEEAAEEIAREIRRIHNDSYGTDIFDIEVLMTSNTIIVIADVEPSPAERTLLEGGHRNAVTNAREAYQQAIESTFIAVVERAVGRRVASFLSSMCVDPLYMVELFRLEPKAAA